MRTIQRNGFVVSAQLETDPTIVVEYLPAKHGEVRRDMIFAAANADGETWRAEKVRSK